MHSAVRYATVAGITAYNANAAEQGINPLSISLG